MMELRAGAARVEITPAPGLELGGGAFGRAEGTLHPLWAKALFLERGAARVLLITCDLLGVSAAFAADVRTAIGEVHGLPADAAMLACTHTHCAPATVPLRAWGMPDPAYMAWLRGRLLEVAGAAMAAARPARLAAGSVVCRGVATNRARKDDVHVDEYLGVLRVTTSDGTTLALLVNHAVHPVNLHSGARYSPDFPHFVEAQLQQALGAAVPVLYLSGAGGDLNPRNFDVHPCEARAAETASLITRAALDALPSLTPDIAPMLGHALREIALPVQALPDRATLEALLAERRAKLAHEDPSPTNWAYTGHLMQIAWAEEALAVREQPTHMTIPLQALRLGDTAILGIPGEPFTAVGQAIRAASPFRETFISTLTNGCCGYFPTSEAYACGSYEAVHCPRFLGLYSFRENVGDVLGRGSAGVLRALCAGEDARTTA